MTDELRDMMVSIYQMTKGELVDIICKLMDDIDRVTLDVANERDKMREQFEQKEQEVETYRESTVKWQDEYKKLWDLVSLGATIQDGKLVYDKQTKMKYIEKLLFEGGPINPPQRQLGIDLTEDDADEFVQVSVEARMDEIKKRLKDVGMTEGERAELLKELTGLIRRKENA